jgi:hypothetical protein
MRTVLFSAVALGALTSVAVAEPLMLTDEQMDKVTAGVIVIAPPAHANGQGQGTFHEIPENRGTQRATQESPALANEVVNE